MLFKILLILSILLQFFAAIIAMKLTRRTRFNSAWILFAIAILLINSQLIYELIKVFNHEEANYYDLTVWTTMIISLCIAIGVFYAEKIIGYIEALVSYRQLYEHKVISSMITAEERERQRIAKELHDGLGPLLSSAKMSMSYLSKGEGSIEERKKLFDSIGFMIDESIRSVREISNNLSPNILTTFGLSRAIANFVNKLALPPTVKVVFDSTVKKDRYKNEVEIVLYRIACELINNAIRHSGCNLVKVSLSTDNEYINLQVIDNGKGFDYNNVINSDKRGLGLSNIKSRMEYINGTISVDSKIGNGTTFVIRAKKELLETTLT